MSWFWCSRLEGRSRPGRGPRGGRGGLCIALSLMIRWWKGWCRGGGVCEGRRECCLMRLVYGCLAWSVALMLTFGTQGV